MSDIFDFYTFVREHPELSWALQETENSEISSGATTTWPTVVTAIHKSPSAAVGGSDEKGEEPVAPTMSPSMIARNVPTAGVTPESCVNDRIPTHTVRVPEVGASDEKGEEPVAPTMSPSMIARDLPTPGVTPESDSNGSSDSLLKLLLKPPSPKRTLEHLQENNLSSKSPIHLSSKEEGGSNEEVEEPVAPTMSLSMVTRDLPRAGVTPESDSNSSSSDSLIRLLLQPPPSKRVSEPLQDINLSSKSLSHMTSQDSNSSSDFIMRLLLQPTQSKRVLEPPTDKTSSSEELSPVSFQEGASSYQPAQELDITFLGGSSLSSDDRTSRKGQKHIFTPSKHTEENVLGDLDAKSALFLAKHHRYSKLQRTDIQKRQFSTDIDPYAVGLVNMHEVLRDGARLTKRLREDEEALGRRKRPCVCDVTKHPSWWPVDRIQDVHNYSFLLDSQDLALTTGTMVASNKSKTVVVYRVPMEHNNPIKLKAEQVLRFVDVEIGFGDQTCYDLFHYTQPSNRKVLLVVSRGRVVGIVVAEEIHFAHRILQETVSFMELEDHPVPVRVGINRLWVHISMRRRHLATILCKLVGICFYGKETLCDEDYAFNNISDSMVAFAKVFLKNVRPPLYCQLK